MSANHFNLPLRFTGFAAALLHIALPAHGDVFEIDAGGVVAVRAADRFRPSAESAAGAAPDFRAALHRIATRHALSPYLLEALVWQESRWRVDARSAKGAVGLTQLMPATARDLGVDPVDPLANLEGGARYLRQQLDRFGDLEFALAAYNAGPARVTAARGVPPIAETRAFIAAVIGRAGEAAPAP